MLAYGAAKVSRGARGDASSRHDDKPRNKVCVVQAATCIFMQRSSLFNFFYEPR
jgi:hypothetical protein